ncbi:MAG: formylglycine-generating enzyme family protein, partial [bacterium]
PTPTSPEPTPVWKVIEIQTDNPQKIALPLRFIPSLPAGQNFQFGPVENVYYTFTETEIDSFWIDEQEVSNALFAAFLNQLEPEINIADYIVFNPSQIQKSDDGKYVPVEGECIRRYGDPFAEKGTAGEASTEKVDCDNFPVFNVTWRGASNYCIWAGRMVIEELAGEAMLDDGRDIQTGALPTEFQWEYAARGYKEEEEYRWPWGSDFVVEKGGGGGAFPFCTYRQYENLNGKLLFSEDNTCDLYDGWFHATAPVDDAKPSEVFKLRQMYGNVMEWTRTTYIKGDGIRDTQSPPPDVVNPTEQQMVVVRGLSYQSGVNPSHVTLLSRTRWDIYGTEEGLGFRCVYEYESSQ